MMTAVVCNNQPMTIKQIRGLHDVPTPSQYYTLLHQILNQCNDSCMASNKDTINLIENELMSPIGYQQYLTVSQTREITRSQKPIIHRCHYIYQQGLFFRYLLSRDNVLGIVCPSICPSVNALSRGVGQTDGCYQVHFLPA